MLEGLQLSAAVFSWRHLLFIFTWLIILSFTFSPSSVKLLPLRPPPIKSIPGRPPPPAINSTSSGSQNPTPSKVSPAPSLSAASQVTPSQTSSSPPPPSTANQTQAQKAPKRGPPLPPRPKPGHPLYNSYVVNLHVHTHTKIQVLITFLIPLYLSEAGSADRPGWPESLAFGASSRWEAESEYHRHPPNRHITVSARPGPQARVRPWSGQPIETCPGGPQPVRLRGTASDFF